MSLLLLHSAGTLIIIILVCSHASCKFPDVLNVNIAPILDQKSPCFVRILQFSYLQSHLNIQVPYVLTNPWTKTKVSQEPVVSLKTRSITCLMTIVILSEQNLRQKKDVLKLHFHYIHLPRIILAGENIHFTPQILIFVVPESQNNFLAIKSLYWDTLKLDYILFRKDPALIYFFLHENSAENKEDISVSPTLRKGFFICNNCGRQDLQILSFGCSGSSCRNEMVSAVRTLTQKGSGILWLVENPTEGKFFERTSPFDRKSPSRLRISILNFLLNGLNSTDMDDYEDILRKAWKKDRNNYKWTASKPWILFSLEDNLVTKIHRPDNLHFYVTGSSSTFQFITSEGIYPRREKSFQRFFMPFDSTFWYYLGGTLLVTSFIIGITSRKYQSHSESTLFIRVFKSVEEICNILLEHGGIKSKTEPSEGNFVKNLLSTWLILSVVITNAYKGVVSSNTLFKGNYETKFETFRDIQSFRLYMPTITPMVCNYSGGILPYSKFTRDNPAFKSYWGNGYDSNAAKWNVFFKRLYDFWLSVTLMNATPGLLKESIKLRYVMLNSSFVCRGSSTSLIQFIGKELKQPKTAFIVERQNFHYYWEIFEAAMDKKSALKFAHNFKTQDPFLKQPDGYYITSGMHETYQLIPNRMKTLLSSGLYWLWTKWDDIRFSNTGNVKEGIPVNDKHESSQASLKPFSTSDPDVYLSFQLFGFCLFVSASVLVLEWITPGIVSYCCHRRFSTLVREFEYYY
ncbi:unnamed protein product [Allacma fusca]|uniref:Uncharacterized protein n=1 Tax=Allacma fusca TaxID=39272 RepID=A0A8J2NUC6_9HEXA|nr:unnamed protein product [Allacma fusca]